MSNTPNYGYNTRIDAIELIDRDIKRVEDKADRNSETKVDKQDGHSLIHKKKLEQITRNQNHIECLSKRIDRADSDITDRYTKSETDTKLQYKADKCELEKHMIDPNAHGALFDGKVDKQDGYGLIQQEQLAQIEINKNDISKMYTQAEVDELLSTKVNINERFPIAVAGKFSETAPMTGEFDRENRIITLNFNAVANADIVNGDLLAVLPVGFRGYTWSTIPLLSMTGSPLTIAVITTGSNGETRLYHGGAGFPAGCRQIVGRFSYRVQL